MRISARLCAAADFGVRFSYAAISRVSASYDMIVLQIKPAPHGGTSSLQVSSLPSVCCKKIFFQTRASAQPRPVSLVVFRALKDKLQRKLDLARFASLLGQAKCGTIRNVSVHA